MINYEPDILGKGLDVIFCGLNPASSAAATGYNFSSSSNRFWRVLHLAGFTDVRLQPQDERRLLEYGCGITAIVRRPTRRAEEVLPEEFRRARRGFGGPGFKAGDARGQAIDCRLVGGGGLRRRRNPLGR